jgi:spore coat polysaccharide biosynthesis protein SpsF
LVVATTTDLADDVLVNWCVGQAIPVYRGSVDDVLDRFWQCAKHYKAELIVRVTADDPLKDPEIIKKALDLCNSTPEVDYVSNTLMPSYPEGLDIEVVRYRALERAAKQAILPSEREHVTPYIWKHPELFVLRSFSMQPDLSHWRWTVDKHADLEMVRHIFAQFSDHPLFSYLDVISWIKEHPEIMMINLGIIRNEGYYKSLAKEQNL